MEKSCLFERFSKIGLGILFLLISIGFMLSGVTVLPIFGFVIALPFFLLSLYFFRAHMNKACQIKAATEEG
jgi:hypothetical protein